MLLKGSVLLRLKLEVPFAGWTEEYFHGLFPKQMLHWCTMIFNTMTILFLSSNLANHKDTCRLRVIAL